MKLSSARLVVTAGLAAALALGGCSVSSKTETTTSVSDGETTTTTTTTTEDGSTTTETTETATSGTESGDSSATSEASTMASDAENGTWKDVYKGKNADFELYYAESPDGKEALLLAYAPSTKNYVFYSGKTSNDSNGAVTLTDDESGAKVVLQITAVSDDENTLTVATSEFGECNLTKATVEDFSADVATITETGTAMDLSEASK